MVFKLCVSKAFQMMRFKVFSKISHRFQWFSNCMFQSVFKIPHRFLCFSNCIFSKCVSMCFQKSPIGFKVFSKLCVSKCFQNCVFQSVFKIPHSFQWFSNDVFQSVFKNLPQVSMVFK